MASNKASARETKAPIIELKLDFTAFTGFTQSSIGRLKSKIVKSEATAPARRKPKTVPSATSATPHPQRWATGMIPSKQPMVLTTWAAATRVRMICRMDRGKLRIIHKYFPSLEKVVEGIIENP